MHTLKIRELSLWVRLGCTPDERKVSQEVRIGVDLVFEKLPEACATDRLSDTICYAKICATAKEIAESREFETVECLYLSVRNGLMRAVPGKTQFGLSVHKVRPPIEGLQGGVFFQDEAFHA